MSSSIKTSSYVSFKEKHDFEKRREECNRILDKYNDRLPIICERSKYNTRLLPDIDKTKYLVPMDLSVSQFMYIIRKRLQLAAEISIYFSINGSVPASSDMLSKLYDKYKDPDGFLYIKYCGENTFGGACASA